MPKGKGTYGSKRGRPVNKSAKKTATRLRKLAGKKLKAVHEGKTKKVKRIQTRAKRTVTRYKKRAGVGKK